MKLPLTVLAMSFLCLISVTQAQPYMPKTEAEADRMHPITEQPSADDEQAGEKHYKPTAEDIRLEGHLAQYALMSRIVFASAQQARDVMADIAHGQTTFQQASQTRNEDAAEEGYDGRSGEMGLVEIGSVPNAVARLAFDVRRPMAKAGNPNIFGPVCISTHECWIFIVLNRYRKTFFSRSWFDVVEFAKNSKMTLSEMIEIVNSPETFREHAYMIWPEEHISFKKLKMDEVKNDLRRIGKEDDPSTQPNAPPKRKDMSYHRRLMKERELLLKHIDSSVIEDHPEIFAMDPPQWVQKGWLSQEHLDKVTAATKHIGPASEPGVQSHDHPDHEPTVITTPVAQKATNPAEKELEDLKRGGVGEHGFKPDDDIRGTHADDVPEQPDYPFHDEM